MSPILSSLTLMGLTLLASACASNRSRLPNPSALDSSPWPTDQDLRIEL
jgi:hypothetical protein